MGQITTFIVIQWINQVSRLLNPKKIATDKNTKDTIMHDRAMFSVPTPQFNVQWLIIHAIPLHIVLYLQPCHIFLNSHALEYDGTTT